MVRSMRDMAGHDPAIDAALAALADGAFVVLLDDTTSAPSGMVALAAEHATPDRLHALDRAATGWSYLALSSARCDELDLEAIAIDDDALPQTVTIAAIGVRPSSGVADRARTIAVAIDPRQPAAALRRGGHVLPLRAAPNGTLERPGHAEAALDLATLAGLTPAAVLGELVDMTGGSMGGAAVRRFAAQRGLPVVRTTDVADQRRRVPRVEHVSEAMLATTHGVYRAHGYRTAEDAAEHLALVRGEILGGRDVLAHIHVSCWQGDVVAGTLCECRARLDAATRAIAAAGRGVIVHLASAKFTLRCVRGDRLTARDLAVGGRILADLGVETVSLLTDDELAMLPAMTSQVSLLRSAA